MNENIIYLLLRRLRAPLIALICVYAVSMLGLVLIPGVDAAGRPWHMDFFHAFYFVSFMGSTIGFGEIPYPFTDAQRLWTTVSIYMTVIAWLYAIANLLAAIQDPAFRRAMTNARFARSVRWLRETFYLVCGYGDTGSLLVRALSERGLRTVVVDSDPERINALQLEDLPVYVPGLCADAGDPERLRRAGLRHRDCAGLVSLTSSDHVNLTVAITAKLLNAQLPVVCRAQTRDAQANMASFGTDHIINPFEVFAERLAMALHAPGMHLLFEWLTSVGRTELAEPLFPPRGPWILCGYGRFGKAVHRYLTYEGIQAIVVEADPQRTQPPEGSVVGRGTEAVTLREAHIERAVGIVAGTDDDTNNLSILMTARDLKPAIFAVARQNKRTNASIFAAARPDLVMESSGILARQILSLITTPLLAQFLHQARHQDNEWANVLVSRIGGIVGGHAPQTWAVTVTATGATAVNALLLEGRTIRLGDLLRDPHNRDRRLPALPLMLQRGEGQVLLPPDDEALAAGDRLLFCGRHHAEREMAWSVRNYNAFFYALTGVDAPVGYLWRRLARRAASRGVA